MGRGAKRRKTKGRRPNTHTKPKPRLFFLCDENMTPTIRQAVDGIKGYRTTRLQDHGLSGALDPNVIREVNKIKSLILTFDRDFTDPTLYKICTHPGVLWLHMSRQAPSYVVPRLEQFLRSDHYSKCKHAVVELRDDIAIVTSRTGQQPEIPHFNG